MSQSRVIRAFLAALLVSAFPLLASAATTDFRILFDVDHDTATGCTVSTMPGVDQVLTTRVDTTATTAAITQTFRQVCTGFSLGAAIPVDSTGWPAGFQSASGQLLVETRLPFSAFPDSDVPHSMRIGLVGAQGAAIHTALTRPNGDPVFFPAPTKVRRRAVSAPGAPRVIVLDGIGTDWNGLKAMFEGIASGGVSGLRIEKFFGFADTIRDIVFFRFDVNISNSAPFAADDFYERNQGEGLVVPGVNGDPTVLANDTDPNGSPLTASLVSQPAGGSVVLDETGGFTYTPTDAASLADDTFEYRASNGDQDSNVATVTISVQEGAGPNQEPSFTKGSDPEVFEDAGPQSIANWATNISAGAGENDQTVTFEITNNSNPSLFADGPTIDADGTLNFTPADDANGIATITVKITDDGGTADGGDNESPEQTFFITVNEVNDAPLFAAGADVTVEDDDGAQNMAWATSVAAGPANEAGQLLDFIIGNDNPALFSVQPSIASDGALSFTPQVGQSGFATISVQLHDDAGTANGGVDTSAVQQFVIAVEKIPVITSGDNVTFVAGQAGTFTVTTDGSPRATINQTGALPAGVTFVDGTGPNKGTGTLAGTPGALTGGVYPLTFQATNVRGSSPIQNFTLTVNQTPTITSGNTATFTRNVAGSFTITTVGYPVPSVALPGALPTGLSYIDNGDGTGTISGTPTAPGGAFSGFVVTASNGVGSNATQNLTIIVNDAPTITSANSTGFAATVNATFTVTTTGFPIPSLGETGALPLGISFVDNGNGTASLGGTAQEGTGGVYPITITASNVAGSTPQSFTITVCNTVAVINPVITSGTVGTPFSQNFTQTGAVGGATFTTASTLPPGLTLATNGTLSGTPTSFGTYPIVVTVVDANGCSGTGSTYTLVISCQNITVTNPLNTNGTAGSLFSETFTEIGAIGGATFTTSSTLPAGLMLATNGVLSGTPTQTGSFPIVVTVTDGNGCTGTGGTYTLVIGCQTINVTNPANANGTAATPFSEIFTQTNAIGTATFTTASTLPAGLTLATNGVLSGIPTQTGSFPIVVTVTDANGCTGTGATYNLVIGCQFINVTNPATTTGTASAAFSETFTQTGAIGTATFTTASTLPAGLTLATNGVLSGTPTQTGSFPIVVTVTDDNGCTGTSATYNLVISCQTITVTNPANPNGTISSPFSETFTQTGAIGTATFTTASTLPAGLTLATNGVLSGTPTQTGSFPIVVTVTDSNGCTGTSATYNLVIACQVISVTNPVNDTGPAGTPFSETFTQTGAIGAATFTTASTLPTGITLSTAGVLSGTPTQGGTFPIVVTVTDSNGCTGTSSTYNLTITCPVITVSNPANANGTANSAFSETFTQTGAVGTATFTINSGTLPTGLSLATNGVLSGTPTQTGSFPITVLVTDSNGCTGTSATYTIVISCQTITVTNPVNATGVANAAFSETFTQTGAIGTATFTLGSGTLPTGLSLATNGVLSGTPTQTGNFPITVTVTDSNGCTGTGATYTIVITCQTITVTNPANATGTIMVPFSETFTQTGSIGTATFTVATGSLPAGLTLSAAGVLSGTPTVTGSFPITVTVTDSNGCTGTGGTYTIIINCQTITVTNPGVSTGTVSAAFSQTFTQSGANLGATFTLDTGTLPAGLTLSTAGVLSGTPTQTGSFPITVKVTDGNGCTGIGATYTLIIGCQTITVTNPVNATSLVSAPFSETFTQSGAFGTATFTTASTLPTGLTLATNGVLSGTPTQTGSFPIVVTVTDSNGCTGTGATYTLVINCQTITVTNPGVTTGTVDSPFSQSFGQTGAIGTATFTLDTGSLPPGLTLSSAGVLSGSPSAPGSFPFTVKVTDSNGCTGTSATYTLVVSCQTLTVVNPVNTNGTAGVAFSETFTETGVGTHGPAVFTIASGTLPTGLTLSTAGVLSGTPTQNGTFPITVTVTDANGCNATGATYNLFIACPTFVFTPANTMPTATFGVAYSQNISVTGGTGPYVLSLANATNVPTSFTFTDNGNGSATIASVSPTVTGTFTFDVNVLSTASGCTTTQTFTLAVAPNAVNDTYSAANGQTDAVGNTEAVAAGFSTPTTPFVTYAASVLANDSAPGGTLTVVTPSVTNAAGTITFNAAGGWSYVPAVNFTGTATFAFVVASNGVPANSSVSIVVTNKVWYVKNDFGAGGTGVSSAPFNTLAAAQTASAVGDIIYVHKGDGTTTGHTAGIVLKANQQLIGNGVALSVNGNALAAADVKPQITFAGSTVITLAAGNTVKGLTVTGGTNSISGAGVAGFIGDTLTLQSGSASALLLTNATGTVTVTNSTLSSSGNVLLLDNGTATITLDSTNTITAGPGARSVLVQNRGAGAGNITLGATINDTGTGIATSANSVGTLAFTGAQTLNTGTANAVSLQTGSGTFVVNFSGTLGITTTTGSGFSATGGGTLNVTGTATITTGAAPNGLVINGVTVGGSGVTFNTVNTTGATTGISLTSIGNGNVTINGGTLSGGTTGVALNTLGTSTTALNNVTISNPATGISGTGGFGTLSIGSNISVTAGTALSLNNGTVSGLGFTTLTSTAGTNGISLTSVGGTVSAASGSISGASGNSIVISGGNVNVTYPGNVTHAAVGFALLSVSNGHTGMVTFQTGTLSATNGTGLLFDNADGTYNFNGTTTLNGTAPSTTAIAIQNGSGGSFSFSTNTSLTNAVAAGNAFSVTDSTAGVTYSGSITKNTNTGLLINVLNHGTGTITFQTGTLSATSGSGIQLSNADGTVNFNGTTTLNGGDAGVDIINGSAGSFSFSATTTITNPSGIAFNVIDSNPVSLDYNGTISGNNARAVDITRAAVGACGAIQFDGNITSSGAAAGGLRVNNCNSGTVSFNAGVTLTTNTNAAITLTTNNGATINFSQGNLTVTTTTGRGFLGSGGGTINVTGVANTITTSNGTAFEVFGTAGVHMAGAYTFRSINADVDGPGNSSVNNNGIHLSFHNGPFTITGDGVDGDTTPDSLTSGGTIDGANERGAEFATVSGAISLGGMTFTNSSKSQSVAGSVCGLGLNTANNTTCNAALYLDTTSGGVTLNKMLINGSAQEGINGYTVTNLVMTDIQVMNAGNEVGENGILLKNLLGTGSGTNLNLHDNEAKQLHIINTTNNDLASFTISGSTFANSSTPNGGQGVLLETYDSGTSMNTTIQTSNFTNLFSNAHQVATNSGSSQTVVLTGNTITNANAMTVIQASDGGNNNFTVSNNSSVTGAMSGSNSITIKTDNADLAGTASVASGTISNNAIGNGSVGSGAVCGGGCNGIVVAQRDGGTLTVNITGNTIRHVDATGIALSGGNSYAGNAGKMVATITGNLIQDPDGPVLAAISATGGTQSGDTNCFQVTIGGTTNPGAWPTTAANTFNRIEGNWDPTTSPTFSLGNEIFLWRRFTSTFNIAGYTGTAFVAGQNSFTSSDGTSVGATGTITNGSCP